MATTRSAARQRAKLPCAIAILAFCGASTAAVIAAEPDAAARASWVRFWEEQRGMRLVLELSAGPPARDLVVRGVTVLPMTGDGALEDHTVVVRDGRITSVGPSDRVELPAAATVVDGSGRFLVPGLTDSHTHTIHSPSQLLVYLTRGVTNLREMDGYPWMLRARARARAGELLIPDLHVAGHILSNRAWDFYMTQVDTVDEVRQRVAEQAAAGYDFVKIHNSMPEPLFSAVFAAAAEAGLPVVGHIPVEIPIADAIAAGLTTNEHFKGYIFDQTLEITEQDYLAATRGSSLWNTPTFTNYHQHLRGEEALASVDSGSLALVPRWMRRDWLRQADGPVDELTALRQSIYPKSRGIFGRLSAVTDRFLAGTDTGDYAFMVPGDTVLEEIRIFEELGMAPLDALATATSNAARALGREGDLGIVAPGARGDLLLLDSDPRTGTGALADLSGVALRGTWLDRPTLDGIESRLAVLFSEETAVPEPTSETLSAFVREAEAIRADGFPYPAYILDEIARFLRDLDEPVLAQRISTLAGAD